MTVLDRISVKGFLFDNIREITLPASILVDMENENVEAPQDPRFQINLKMDTLLARSADVSIVLNFAAYNNKHAVLL